MPKTFQCWYKTWKIQRINSVPKTNQKDLNENEAKYEVKRAILDARVRLYIEREARLVSSMNKIYGTIRGQCNPGLKSVLKGNEDLISK